MARYETKIKEGAQPHIELASPMALAVTQRRLLSLKVSALIGLGLGGKVEGLVASAPLSDVDSIEVKRLCCG